MQVAMNHISEALFWIGSLIAVYSYAIYPLLLNLLKRSVSSARNDPSSELLPISVVITARNEEKRIKEKLENTLALEYPRHLVTILVASDASTDATDDIVRSYGDHNVTLIRSQERKGKEHAQLLAVKSAITPILVFTDTATRLTPDALLNLAKNFADPTVGAVSSEDELLTPEGEVRGEGAYVRYEMWLRRLESQVAGLVGLSGSCFAVRREVCERWRIDTPSDITVALLCAQAGKRAVCDDSVKGSYQDLKDESREFERKKRTIIRGMTAVWELREALNPLRYRLFAFQVWSHKVMRWFVPIGLLMAFAASAMLLNASSFYRALFWIQVVGYVVALLGHFLAAFRKLLPIRIAVYFVVANLATAAAGWDFLRGVRITTWNPSQR